MKFRTRLLLCAVVVSTAFALWGRQAYARTLKVAIYDNRPLCFLGPAGTPKGIYVDVLDYVAKKEGYKIEYMMGTWPESLKRLDKKQCDVLVAIAYTNWRQRKYAFTKEAVLSNWGRVYARPGVKLQSFLDLNGRSVAVPRDDIYFTKLVQLLNNFGITCRFMACEGYQEVIKAVAARQVDAGITSRFATPPKEMRGMVSGTPLVFAPIELKFAFPKTMDATVIAAFDKHLAALKSDEQSLYYQALDGWLGRSDIRSTRQGMWALGAVGGAILFLGFVIVFLAARNKRVFEQERRKGDRRAPGGRREGDREKVAFEATVVKMSALAGDTLMCIDPENSVVNVATGYIYEMFGYLPSSARELAFEKLIDEDKPELEPDLAVWAKAARDKEREYFKWAAKHTNGDTFIAESCCRLVEIDGEERLVCVVRDVNARDGVTEKEPEDKAEEEAESAS